MRPTLANAVQWIAMNDETAEMNVDVIATFISTTLVADLFGKDPNAIAKKVWTIRARENGTADRIASQLLTQTEDIA